MSTRTALKAYFETGDKPTEAQFADLIDSILNLDDDDSDDLTEGATNKFATAVSVDAAGATMNADTDVSGNGWVLDQDDLSGDDDTKVPTQQSVKAYIDAFKALLNDSDTLTDGAAIAWDLESAIMKRAHLTTAESAPTLTLSNVLAGSEFVLHVKKTIAGDTTVSLAGTGLAFKGYNSADYGTTSDVVLSGAANDYFTLTFTVDPDLDGGDKVVLVALGPAAN